MLFLTKHENFVYFFRLKSFFTELILHKHENALVLKTISEIRPRKSCDWMYQFPTQHNDWRASSTVSFIQADFSFLSLSFSLSPSLSFGYVSNFSFSLKLKARRSSSNDDRSSGFVRSRHEVNIHKKRQCLLLFIIKHRFLVKNKTILITTLAGFGFVSV